MIELISISPIEKNRKSKKGANGNTDPEKSSIKRPTGTSPVNILNKSKNTFSGALL